MVSRVQIILTLDDLNEQEKEDLRYLLTDALAEFEFARRGNYVERRYKDTFTGQRLEKKKEEVERRRALAKRLKEAAHHYQIVACPNVIVIEE